MSTETEHSVKPIIPPLNALARFFEPAADPLLRATAGLLLMKALYIHLKKLFF